MQTLPATKLAPDPYLKTSGVAVVLGEVFEADGKFAEAYDVYSAAHKLFETMLESSNSDSLSKAQKADVRPGQSAAPSNAERMRAVALALKLGEMAATFSFPSDMDESSETAEEDWLGLAVRDVLQILADDRMKTVGRGVEEDIDKSKKSEGGDLQLPRWCSLRKTEIIVPIERLGTLYARQGKPEYVILECALFRG